MNKQTSHAFGKDVYLLGKLKTGEYIWLEAAQWDCEWYWGFGYIETYRHPYNRYPDKARDIQSHTHWSGLMGKQEVYDFEKKCFRLSDKYVYHINENPNIAESVLTDKESWELSDLMKSFYTLKETAELFHMGNSHLTTSSINLKNQGLEDHINKVLMPQIFKRVYEILTPND